MRESKGGFTSVKATTTDFAGVPSSSCVSLSFLTLTANNVVSLPLLPLPLMVVTASLLAYGLEITSAEGIERHFSNPNPSHSNQKVTFSTKNPYLLSLFLAKGMAAKARIAAYKSCWKEGCLDSDIFAAMGEAVDDGIHVISLSVGSTGVAGSR